MPPWRASTSMFARTRRCASDSDARRALISRFSSKSGYCLRSVTQFWCTPSPMPAKASTSDCHSSLDGFSMRFPKLIIQPSEGWRRFVTACANSSRFATPGGGSEEEDCHTRHEHHVRDVENAGSQATDTHVQEVRDPAVVGQPIYPVAHAAARDEREARHVPGSKAFREERRQQGPETGKPHADDEKGGSEVNRERFTDAEEGTRIFGKRQSKGVTGEGMFITKDQLVSRYRLGDLVA